MSVGQQSVIGMDIRSDFYMEKVSRWINDTIYENNCDNISLSASEMLLEITQDEHVDESYFSISKCVTNNDSQTPLSTSDLSDAFPSRDSSFSSEQMKHVRANSRLPSKDSGIDCACLVSDNGHNASVTVIRHHQEATNNPLQLAATNITEYNEMLINSNTTENRKCSAVQDTRDFLSAGLGHCFYSEASTKSENGDDDEYPYIQDSVEQHLSVTTSPVKKNNRGAEFVLSKGLEAMQSGNAKISESDELGNCVHSTIMTPDGEDNIWHKSTIVPGEYIELEAVHKGRSVLESGYDDELEPTEEENNYAECDIFDRREGKLKSERLFLMEEPRSDNLKFVNSSLKSTEMVGDYIELELAKTDAEKSSDFGRLESRELCHCVKHCDNHDVEHSRSPDPVEYAFNDEGYIINQN